jgi:predicted dehydrogenase
MFRNLAQCWKARELIDSGVLGDVQIVNVYHNSDQISGTGCQPLSVMRLFANDANVDWAFGWVTGDAAEDSLKVKPELDAFSDDDQGMAGCIRFSNGVHGYVHYDKTPKDEIEVLCSKGAIMTDYRSFRLFKLEERGGHNALTEEEGVFQSHVRTSAHYEPDGWKRASSRVMDTVQSMVDALEMGVEPRSNGDNAKKVLEIAIGLRESERRGMTAVKFPLEDRSLRLVPKKGRMFNKKKVYGPEWYKEQISQHKRGSTYGAP